MLDWSGKRGDDVQADEAVLVVFVLVGWWLNEVDFREQTSDVAFGEQPTEDCKPCGFRVAIAAASLGCDETVVVVDAEDGAGAHVDSGVGGFGSMGQGLLVDGSVAFLGIIGAVFSIFLYLLSWERGYRHQLSNQADGHLRGT